MSENKPTVQTPDFKGGVALQGGADRGALAEKSKEIAKALWSGKLTGNEQAALNQICLLYKLDPILKQVLCLGGNVYITGGGLTVIANQDPSVAPDGIELVPADQEERENAFVPEASHYWKCILYKKGSERPFIEFGEACFENVGLHKKGWKELQDMAKNRARNRAIRMAYGISFTSLEETDFPTLDPEMIDVTPPGVQEPPPGESHKTHIEPSPVPEKDTLTKGRESVRAIQREKKFSDAEFKGWYCYAFGVESFNDLSADQLRTIYGLIKSKTARVTVEIRAVRLQMKAYPRYAIELTGSADYEEVPIEFHESMATMIEGEFMAAYASWKKDQAEATQGSPWTEEGDPNG